MQVPGARSGSGAMTRNGGEYVETASGLNPVRSVAYSLFVRLQMGFCYARDGLSTGSWEGHK